MVDWIAATAGVVVGGELTMATGWFADMRLTKRERERRKEDRHERFLIRRNDFQRDTLLQLQVASQKNLCVI